MGSNLVQGPSWQTVFFELPLTWASKIFFWKVVLKFWDFGNFANITSFHNTVKLLSKKIYVFLGFSEGHTILYIYTHLFFYCILSHFKHYRMKCYLQNTTWSLQNNVLKQNYQKKKYWNLLFQTFIRIYTHLFFYSVPSHFKHFRMK